MSPIAATDETAAAAIERESDAEQRQHFLSIVRGFRSAMVITRRGDDVMARPMTLAKVGDDGELYFATSVAGTLAHEIEHDARVDVVLQGSSEYAVATGRARIDRDRALIDALWSEAWKIWFPKGKDDPQIAIVVVTPARAEYWDEGGTKGISFLFRAAKAYLKGARVSIGKGEHGKLLLH